jgi:putative solute:sodium symporter small subunit
VFATPLAASTPKKESCIAETAGGFLQQDRGETMADSKAEVRKRHWAKTRNLTIFVLIVWFIFSFVVHWFAKDLNEVSFIGFPLGYYFAAQGSLIIFVVLIFFQNWRQDRIDEEAGLSGDSTKQR